jgi:hypothetical protein
MASCFLPLSRIEEGASGPAALQLWYTTVFKPRDGDNQKGAPQLPSDALKKYKLKKCIVLHPHRFSGQFLSGQIMSDVRIAGISRACLQKDA